MELNIAYTSKRDLSREKQYSFSMEILSNHRNNNWLIHPLPQIGMNKFCIYDHNKFIYPLPEKKRV